MVKTTGRRRNLLNPRISPFGSLPQIVPSREIVDRRAGGSLMTHGCLATSLHERRYSGSRRFTHESR